MNKENIKVIVGGRKEIIYSVEIPETDNEFYNGLAYRKSVPEKMLKGYKPKIDDNITGVLWLNGYIK